MQKCLVNCKTIYMKKSSQIMEFLWSGRGWCEKYYEFYKGANIFPDPTFILIFQFSLKRHIYWLEVLTFNFIPEMLPLPSQFQLLMQEKVQKSIWSLFHFPILSIVESGYWRQKELMHSPLLNKYPRNRRNKHYL